MAGKQRVGHSQFVADLVNVCSEVLRRRSGFPPVRSAQLMELVAESFCITHGRRFLHVTRLSPDAIAAAVATPRESDVQRRRWNVAGFVAELVRIGATRLDEAIRPTGCDPQETMLEVAGDFVQRNSGCDIYIPAANYLAHRRRNAEINRLYAQDSPVPGGPRKFSGARADELATAFGLSTAQVYNVIKAARDDLQKVA